MAIAIVYFLIILFFIYKNGLFGIFNDTKISRTQFSLLFIFKCLAIPVFYWVYEVKYGGIHQYDAGLFFKDSKIINSIAYANFPEYLKLLFGIQDDSPGSYLYTNYLNRTFNWDEGTSWRLFFNDNKTIIRFHSIIHFISFNSYYVHALFSCLLSYIGITFIYRSLKHLFVSKEMLLISAFIFLPNIWLYTGALLKEPIVLFNIGVILLFTNYLFETKQSPQRKIAMMIGIAALIYCLKPQITGIVFLLYLLYKLFAKSNIKMKGMAYILSIVIAFIVLNFGFLATKGVSVATFINKKQAEFIDVMNGGIFLKDNKKFVRLPYDTTLINQNAHLNQNNITIKRGVKFLYWEDSHQADTLICESNQDTIQTYSLIYKIVPAKSGYKIPTIERNFSAVQTIVKSIYHALVYPLKFDGLLNTIASMESLFFVICLFISIISLAFVKDRLTVLWFITLFIALLIMFGIATPNTGAILRYRSVVSPFIVLALIYSVYQLKKVKK